MERPESATKVPEAGRRISPARYCTTTRRPRKAEYRAILYSVSETSSNRVNSTKGPPPKNYGKTVVRMWEKSAENRAFAKNGTGARELANRWISAGKVLRRRGWIFPARRTASRTSPARRSSNRRPKTQVKRNSYSRKSRRLAPRGREEARAA